MIRTVVCFLLLALIAPLASAQSVSDTELEAFLGIPAGSLDDLSASETVFGGDVTSGSAIQTTFTVEAGDTITAELNFLTNEDPFGEFPEGPEGPEGPVFGMGGGEGGEGEPEPNPFEDFLFASIVVEDLLTVLESVNLSLFDITEDSFFAFETGFFTFEHTFAAGGEVTVGFGVVDVEDEVVDSAFQLDELMLNGELIENGGFETGDLTGFDAIGDVSIATVGTDGGEFPTEALAAGAFLAIATTAGGDIPEPASSLMLGLAVLLLGMRRRQ